MIEPVRTRDEVAAIMTERGYPMKGSAVYFTERRAMRKLREHPQMREIAIEMGWQEEPEGKHEL